MKKACTVLNFFLDPIAYYHKTRHHPLEMTDSYVLDIKLVYNLRVLLTALQSRQKFGEVPHSSEHIYSATAT